MHRPLAWFVISLFLAGPAAAAEPMGKLVRDDWDAAYLDDQKAGYVHTTVHEIERDGKKVLRAHMALQLTVKRFQDTVRMKVETGTDETPDGNVTRIYSKQSLGKDQELELTGTVEGDQLHLKVHGQMNMDKKVKWNDKVIGLYKEQLYFKDKKAKPGDSFNYLQFEPLIGAVVTVRVAVKDREEVKIYGTAKKLLRAEAVPDKIQGVQLPSASMWMDDEGMVVRRQVMMPGLGKMVTVRTTKEVALAPVIPAKITDIGLTQLIPLNKTIDKPHDTSLVVFKITLPKDDDPATAIAQDNRQSIKNVDGKSFELHIKAVRQPPAKAADDSKVGDEYLKSSLFITSADALVQQHAKKAVGDETDAWKKAQRIEKWVRTNMKETNFTEAMATADRVAKTLEGDCTEHAMLAAAMCRAAGVPSKIAVGLVYADGAKGPILAYHMWTEVWVRGEWVPIDATLGRGSIGSGHIKISDHSWYDTQSLTPLLPVMRVMLGKPAIEVIRVEGAKK